MRKTSGYSLKKVGITRYAFDVMTSKLQDDMMQENMGREIHGFILQKTMYDTQMFK
jgi:hypothetical protein